ncbi:hypothetical protein K503DRAFT_772728 [Rhizopogon vinicolor AM-OR11-026]|uniref:Uncharacterized protein n=1 Tax=Rhizopogon vinicolor AM-OR11-026 TaxID=1314800 RepID=A0A1B7MUH4_9AGAM|nr:hypothetical protein K503DRAFT_772728 [Rhizopogon vinicolor AM-OR11-026]
MPHAHFVPNGDDISQGTCTLACRISLGVHALIVIYIYIIMKYRVKTLSASFQRQRPPPSCHASTVLLVPLMMVLLA